MRRFRWFIAPVIGTTVALAMSGAVAPAQTGGGGAKPIASDVGITDTTINLKIVAAVDVPGAAGLFQGVVDGVKAWAQYTNDHGGLAKRKINVSFVDSKLDTESARAAFIQGCSDSFSLIGTSVLFLQNFDDLINCKDKTGAAIGLPDFPVVVTEINQQCSPVSYAINPATLDCSTRTQHPQTYRANTGPSGSYVKKFGKLKGAFLYPRDSQSAKASQVPIFTAQAAKGISDVYHQDVSALAPRSDYTSIAQGISGAGATYARSGLDAASTVKLRQESNLQHVQSVKVWDCSLQCYDAKLLSQGGPDVEGENVYTPFLPFLGKNSEVKQNAMLANFLKYDKTPNGFGVQAWSAGIYFRDLVNKVVAKGGVNALTRKNLLAEASAIHNFTADGMIGTTDVGGRVPSPCYVLNQVKNNDFVRITPKNKGTFNCDPTNDVTVKLDLIK